MSQPEKSKQVTKNGVVSTIKLELHKDLILKAPQQTSQRRLMDVKETTYGEAL